MNPDTQNESCGNSQQNEPELFAMVKKIQQHLVFLERKIDNLIQQSGSPHHREGHFPKPRRTFGHSHRPDRGKSDRVFQRDGQPRNDRRFSQKDEGGNQSFFSRKKRFFRHEKD